MDATIRLEIQNRTPFPLTWAHLEGAEASPGRGVENLLAGTIAPSRGLVLAVPAMGRATLVVGFARREAGARTRAESTTVLLADDSAWSACVAYDETRDAFGIRWLDAHAPTSGGERERPYAGRYRWNGRRGEPRYKRERAGGGR